MHRTSTGIYLLYKSMLDIYRIPMLLSIAIYCYLSKSLGNIFPDIYCYLLLSFKIMRNIYPDIYLLSIAIYCYLLISIGYPIGYLSDIYCYLSDIYQISIAIYRISIGYL